MRNREIVLTHKEATREGLIAYAKNVPYARIGIKIAAMLLTVEGQRPGWVAEVLGTSRESLNNWIHAVNKDGLNGLEWKPRSGRPCKMTGKIQTILEKSLEKTPMEVGLSRIQWDGPTLVTYLKRRFGIILKVRQAQYWMHHLGFRMKRAGYSYIQAKSNDGKRFLARLKKTSNSGTA